MSIYEELENIILKNPQDYNKYIEIFPKLELLKTTPQDAYYHGEGDVWTHTKMVCDELLNLKEYSTSSNEEKFIMFMSCLLHDIAKPDCTKIENGKLTSAGHSKRGAIDARIDLWKKEFPFFIREAIVNIIGTHQIPFFAFESFKQNKTAEFIAHELSCKMPLNLLINVATADMKGRVYPEKQKSLDDIELFKELAIEQKCLYTEKEFPDQETKLKYFLSDGMISPDYKFFNETGSNVIVLSGLPASGKNTWIEKNNIKNLPVLSFDDAKEELNLTEKNPGKAVHLVTDRAKELLREKKDFIWNATHLSKQMRSKTLNLLYNYNARVNLVYLEASEKEIKLRNNNRNSTLKNEKIDEMLFRWEVPSKIESHSIVYLPNHLMKNSNKPK